MKINNIINNIDVGNVSAFINNVKKDKSNALKVKKIEGEWNLEGGTQFISTLEHSQGTTIVEADAPIFMGGSGIKPDPVQYCLFGLAACFAQTFASIAAEKGIKLKELKVSAENKVNLSKALGLSDEPIVEKVKLQVRASSENRQNLDKIRRLAEERCPGVYCLTNPIRLEVELEEF